MAKCNFVGPRDETAPNTLLFQSHTKNHVTLPQLSTLRNSTYKAIYNTDCIFKCCIRTKPKGVFNIDTNTTHESLPYISSLVEQLPIAFCRTKYNEWKDYRNDNGDRIGTNRQESGL